MSDFHSFVNSFLITLFPIDWTVIDKSEYLQCAEGHVTRKSMFMYMCVVCVCYVCDYTLRVAIVY